jgi:hypothetical protein
MLNISKTSNKSNSIIDTSIPSIYYSIEKQNQSNLIANKSYELLPYNSLLLTNIDILITINDYTIFFHIPTEYQEICNMNLSKNYNYLIQADTIKSDSNSNQNSFYLFTYSNINANTNNISLSHLLNNSSSPQYFLLQLINCFSKILKAIYLLVQKEIVHNFINLSSIVCCSKYEYRLSQFLYSFSIPKLELTNNIEDLFSFYDCTYIERPIELQLLSYLNNNKLETLSFHNIEIIMQDYLKYIEPLFFLQSKELIVFRKQLSNYLYTFQNKSKKEIWDIISLYFNTWDTYQFAILYIKIIHSLLPNNPNLLNYPFFYNLFPLLKQMCDPLPTNRISNILSLSSFYLILEKIEKTDWIQCIKDLKL